MLGEGQFLGPYEIVARVGQGGMATVYKAYHEKLDRHVAIKVLHETLLQEPGFLARFEREARIIARLEHPNIVPVYDFADYEGRPYLVMKYIEGQTLEDILKEKALPLSEIVRIMDAVADALTYAHEKGILHRDVKPSNVIIDARNIPYLTDFGLARLVRRGASTLSQGSIIGTPHYISPEQALGQRELDSRTDVYSLGVVLFELVVGRVPFTGDTPFAIVHDHIYAALPDPSQVNPEVPGEVSQVLQRALAKNPDERFETPNALMAAFRRAVEVAGLIELSPDRSIAATQSMTFSQAQQPTPPPQESTPPVESAAPASAEPESVPRPPARSVPPVAPPLPPPPPSRELLPAAPENDPFVGKRDEPVDWERVGEEWGERVTRWSEEFGPRVEQWAALIGTKIEEGMEEGKWAENWEKRGRDRRGRDRGRDRSSTQDESLTPEERIRRDIEERIENRNEFFVHLGIYIVTNGLIWVMWGVLAGLLGGICTWPWALLVTLGWGIGIVAHFLDYWFKYGPPARARQLEIERELARARQSGLLPADEEVVLTAKRKHEELAAEDSAAIAERRVRLTDDGEFTDSFVEELDASERERHDQA